MPIIQRSIPLLPEGEYVGVARRVTMEWSKSKPQADGSKTEPHPVFVLPLTTHNGQKITTRVHVTPLTGRIWEQVAKSGDLVLPPENEPFTVTVDHLENRKFYFGIVHEEHMGQKQAVVKFHVKSYSIGIDPSLESVAFPGEAPRGIPLRSAKPVTTSEEPPAEAFGAPAPHPPSPTKPLAAASLEGLDSLSDEEFAQAIQNAKQQRAKNV